MRKKSRSLDEVGMEEYLIIADTVSRSKRVKLM